MALLQKDGSVLTCVGNKEVVIFDRLVHAEIPLPSRPEDIRPVEVVHYEYVDNAIAVCDTLREAARRLGIAEASIYNHITRKKAAASGK